MKYFAPADDDTSTAGGAVDRGDNYIPADADADAEAQRLADEAATAEEAALAAAASEAAGEEGEEVEDKPARKDTRIPVSRHKEILERERAQRATVEAELARYKQGDAVARTNTEITQAEDKLLALEGEYAKLVNDGDVVKAAAKMSEIRRTERGIIETKATMEMQAATARAVEQVRYDLTVERLEEAYPQFSPEHEDFDRAKVAEVLDLRDAFTSRGETPSAALQKAVKYVMGTDTAKQATAVTTTPRVSEADAKAAARKVEAVKRNTDVAARQPASLTKAGANHDAAGGSLDAKAVIKMPYEQFVKLDDATLSRMRGDEYVGA